MLELFYHFPGFFTPPPPRAMGHRGPPLAGGQDTRIPGWGWTQGTRARPKECGGVPGLGGHRRSVGGVSGPQEGSGRGGLRPGLSRGGGGVSQGVPGSRGGDPLSQPPPPPPPPALSVSFLASRRAGICLAPGDARRAASRDWWVGGGLANRGAGRGGEGSELVLGSLSMATHENPFPLPASGGLSVPPSRVSAPPMAAFGQTPSTIMAAPPSPAPSALAPESGGWGVGGALLCAHAQRALPR